MLDNSSDVGLTVRLVLPERCPNCFGGIGDGREEEARGAST